MKKFCLLISMLSPTLLISPVVGAAEDGSDLIPIIVTASRVEESAAQRAASSVVIDRQQIEQQNARDLGDLLRFHSGLDIGRSGGPGQLTSVFVRGAESNHVLVLVDGVRINPATIGVPAIQNIEPHLIERVEIVKGPRSTLYGSDAIGAVVNVITRNGTDNPAGFTVGGGSFNTFKLSGQFEFGTDGSGFAAGASLHDTDGFSARTDSTDDHGYDNTTLNASLWHTAGDHRGELKLWRSQGNTEYAGFFLENLDQDFVNQSVQFSLESRINDAWSSNVNVSHLTDDLDQKQPGFDGSFDFLATSRLTLDWQNTLQDRNDNRLILGLHAYDESAEALSFGLPIDEDTTSVAAFTEYNLKGERYDTSIAARFTDHSDAGSATTWHIDTGVNLTPALQVIAAAGTGFRAPDATDRYGFGGNPDLEPEESTTLEIGLRYQLGAHHLFDVRLFDQKIDNLINYVVTDFVTFAGTNQNIDKTRTKGLELRHQFSRGPVTVATEVTLQDPKDETSDMLLLRRAEESLTTNISYRFANSSALALNVLASGERDDIDSQTFARITNPGYVLGSLSYSLPVLQNWTIRATIDNVLDAKYETADGFRSAERSYFMEFAYSAR